MSTVSPLPPADHLAAISRDGREVVRLVGGKLSAPVRSCEPWRVADLLWHLGEVHFFWNEIVRTSATDPTRVPRLVRPDDDDLATWYLGNLEALLATLADADPSGPCWSWTGPVTASWVIRRVAHETAVHAWDAANATGAMFRIAAELASDGIDEFLGSFLPHHRETALPIGGSVHVHCTDVEGEWLITPSGGMDLVVTREHAKGSCAIRGAANDLLLVLWRRLSLDAVEVIGDMNVADKFVERTSLE